MTGDGSEPTETRFDLIDRFEHVIGLQATTLGDVGERAGSVTRLVVLVLGLVLSALSIGIRKGGPLEVAFPTVVTFVAGIVGLLVSIAGAIVTYLSIRIRLGVHPASAAALERTPIGRNEYSRLLVGSYADLLKDNRHIIEENVRRFRYTLTALTFGISHLGLATLTYVALSSEYAKWVVVGIGSLTTLVLCGFVLSGRYLVMEVQ